MQNTNAPNTDPLPTASTCCARSVRKPTRWTPYGSRSAPPTARRDSFPLKSSPACSLPISPRLTPVSGPSTGQKSYATTIEDITESTQDEKHVESHETKPELKNTKKYEYTDDFIDVMLGILSLIYCSPLLIAGGRTFVIPQNFSTQPPPIAQTSTTSTSTAITHHTSKPNHMRWFVERLLERTRPPRAVCQLAVAYLVSVSDAVQGELRAAAETRLRHASQHHQHHSLLALPMPANGAGGGAPLPYSLSAPRTPDNQLPPPYSASPAPTPAFTPLSAPIGMPPAHLSAPTPTSSTSALLDPRRVLLAAMVLAHKFHLDKTWTNKAWAKVSGLEAREVGRCERTVAIALGHRLWAGRA